MLIMDCCPICNEPGRFTWAEVEDYTISQCSRCGHRYVSAQPSESAGEVYDEEYYETMNLPKEAFKRRYYAQRLLDLVPSAREARTLLDVGCGTGIFVDVARALGFDTTGVEPSRWASQYAREERNLDVQCGQIEDISPDRHSFDIITLWEVIEHMEAPVEALRHAHRLLGDDGLLVLSVPNSRGPVGWCRWGRELMPWWHLQHFTPRTIRLALEKSGFRIIRLQMLSVQNIFQCFDACQSPEQNMGTPASLPVRFLASIASPLRHVRGAGRLSKFLLNMMKANDRIVVHARKS